MKEASPALATVINYLDRQTLSVVAPVIMEQFHMTNVGYSFGVCPALLINLREGSV